MEIVYNWQPFPGQFLMGKSDLFGSKHTKFYLTAERTYSSISLRLCLAACSNNYLNVAVKWADTFTSRGWGHQGSRNQATTLSLDKERISFLSVGIPEISQNSNDKENQIRNFRVSIQVNFTEIYPVVSKPQVQPTKAVQPSTKSHPVFDHKKGLTDQFAALRLTANHSDVTLVTTLDGQEFPVHKCILSARSTVFETMFGNEEFLENQKHRVEIDDISGEVMEGLLKYVYEGDVHKIKKIAGDLLTAADKYDIPLLGEECLQTMLGAITVENAAKYFYLADLHNLLQLKRPVAQFIAQNKNTVRASTGWNEFIRPNGPLLGQLFDLM